MKFLRRPYVIALRLQFQEKQSMETRAKQRTLLMLKSLKQQKKKHRLKSLSWKSRYFYFKGSTGSSTIQLQWFSLVVCYYTWKEGNFADCKRQVLQLTVASRLHPKASRPNLIKKQPQQHTQFHMTAMFPQSSPGNTKKEVVPSFLYTPSSQESKILLLISGHICIIREICIAQS